MGLSTNDFTDEESGDTAYENRIELCDYVYVTTATDIYTNYSNFNYKNLGTLVYTYTHKSIESGTEDLSNLDVPEEITFTIVGTGDYYLLFDDDYHYLYKIDQSNWSSTLVTKSTIASNNSLCNSGKNIIFLRGRYSTSWKKYPFSDTVYVNGSTITLTKTGNILNIGYDKTTNSIVYVTSQNNSISGTYPWYTYIYDLDSGETFLIDERDDALYDGTFACCVLEEDGGCQSIYAKV